MSVKKVYVLDTNVLLSNPDCLKESFEENDIVIPLTVLEELDNLKSKDGDKGYCARQALRQLESIRGEGNIHEGVTRNDLGSILKVVYMTNDERESYNKIGLSGNNDDVIIFTALKVQTLEKRKENGLKVIFVSNDTSARIKSSLLDIPAQFYKAGSASREAIDYTGYTNIELPLHFFGKFDEETDVFTPIRLPSKLTMEELGEYLDIDNFFQNEFLLISPDSYNDRMDKKEKKKLKAVYRLIGDTFVKRNLNSRNLYANVVGKNLEQSAGIDILLDDDIKVVALTGLAGSGKTLLSLATGLTKIFKEQDSRYEKIILLKPTVSVSDEIGFLPGNVEEKLSHYMGSYLDNFKTLRKLEIEHSKSAKAGDKFEELVASGKIEIESISFIRGRTFSDAIVIIDETQNLTQATVKTILTRVGENCKIILIGDILQIDRAYLSKFNNGLTYAIDKLKNQDFFGHIKFTQGVRSTVSRVCAELL
jgi:PhoH-like ATPase